MKEKTLNLDGFLPAGDHFHFSRAVLSKQPQPIPHSHDFYELFWLHHGQARHRINGLSEILREGHILFVRPGDSHSLQGKGDETHIVNLALPKQLIDDFQACYQLGERFFWSKTDLPFKVSRNSHQLADLSHKALLLESGPRNKLAISAFVLSLMAALDDTAEPVTSKAPQWLQEALNSAQKRSVFAGGAAGLVKVSGRSHPHVSRAMQKYLGQSPSEFINNIRMQAAGRDLIGSSDGLAEIAQDCGISNLSHFHKLFVAYHKTTPAEFRKRFQKDVIQPI